jgi:drug/metabolite transporter (DMT)-like permease
MIRIITHPYSLLAFTALVWGGNAVASRLSVGEVSPMVMTTLRWVLTAALLLPFVWRDILLHARAIRAAWVFIILMSIIGFSGFNALMYSSALFTTAVNITLLQGSIPVMVFLGAWIAYKTSVSRWQIIGTLITLIGVLIIAAHGDFTKLASLYFNFGDLLMLTACLLYAIYTVALRKRPDISALVIFTIMSAAAMLTTLPLLAIEMHLGHDIWPHSLKGWLLVLYVGLLPSLMGQVMFLKGVEQIGPGRAGLFVNLVPVFGALLAVLILSEPFHTYHAIALTCVLGGIILAEMFKTSAA